MRHDLSSHAAYERAIEYLSTSTAGQRANAVWGTYDKAGKILSEWSGACHGSCLFTGTSLVATMSMGRKPGGRDYLVRANTYLNVPKAMTTELPLEILDAWTDWFAHRSWAASHVCAPDVEFVRDHGFVFDPAIPANHALALVTMGRVPGEHCHLVRRWYDLIERFGLTGDVAFAIAFGIETSDCPFGKAIGGHAVLTPNASLAYLRNVATQTIIVSNELATTGAARSGVQAMWGRDYSDGGLVRELTALKPKVVTSSVVIPNPFAPVAKASPTISEGLLHEVIPDLVPILSKPCTKLEKSLAA